MGLPEKRIPGDKLNLSRATDWNSILDAALDARASRAGQQVDDSAQFRPPQTVGLVKNNSSQGLDRFAVLALGAPLITPSANLSEFKERPAFAGTIPAAADVASLPARWCVLLEAIPPGGVGSAQFAGVCPVQVNMVHANDPYADLCIGQTYLQSGTTGARILWAESGTGLLWAVVEMDAQPVSFVRITSLTKAGPFYPAIEQIYYPQTDTWADGALCWYRDANG